jgi:ankyrin repeat protein
MPPRNSALTMERPPRSPTNSNPRVALTSISPSQESLPQTSSHSSNQPTSSTVHSSSRTLRQGGRKSSKQLNSNEISNDKERRTLSKSSRKENDMSGKSRIKGHVDLGSSTTVALEDSEHGWAKEVLPSPRPASPSPTKRNGRPVNPRPSKINDRLRSTSPRSPGISYDRSLSPRPSRILNVRSQSPRPTKVSQRSYSPNLSRKNERFPSPGPSPYSGLSTDRNSSQRLSEDFEGDSDESDEDWRGEFAQSLELQTGIPFILDNGLPSVPVLAKGDNAKFHECIKDNNWVKLEKLLKNFDAKYYKKKRLQVKERREQEMLRIQQQEDEAKEAMERAAAADDQQDCNSTGTNSTTRRSRRRFFPSFSQKYSGTDTQGSDSRLVTKILPKSLAAKILVDPEEVLSPLLMVDEKERTPLHLACIHRAPETMLLTLMTAERKAAMMQDESGQVPLHCAVETWQYDHVIEKIISAYPHALKTKDNAGKTPIGLSVQLAVERQKLEFKEDPENRFMWIHPTCKEEEKWQFQQEKIWAKVNLLLKGLMKRNKTVIPSEHGLILEALVGGADPNTINRFVSTADRYLISDDELAGTAIGLCVERHYPLDTLEYVIDNCRDKTTMTTDAVTKALRAHYRQGCRAIREGMTPFGKQVIDWCKATFTNKSVASVEETPKKTTPTKKKKPSLKKKEIAGNDEKQETDQWGGMDESCKQWWEILNYLVFFSAYGRGYKETVKPMSIHLLHAALSIPLSPPSLIQLVLIVYPEARKVICPVYRALPIHIACTRWRYDIVRGEADSSLDRVLKLMLKLDPEKILQRHRGRLPIHLALSVGQSWSFIKAFVAADKNCVGMRDPQSRFFPFQMAALPMTSKNAQLLMRSKFTPTEWRIMSTGEKKLEYREVEFDQDRKQVGTIYEVLRRHPDALVGKPLLRGNAPVQKPLPIASKVSTTFLAYVYGRNLRGEYRLRTDNVRVLRDAIVRADIPLEMENWWECMKESIWEEYHGDIPRNDQYLLHAALYNPESPPLLVELLVEIFPASVSKPVPGTAIYPLHIAAATTSYHRHSFEMAYGMDSLHLVLSANGRVARRRSNGRLPLHIALARGKSWKEVRPLVSADPSSLMMEDPQTGLVPFQLIASFNVTSRENAIRFSAFIERQARCLDLDHLSTKEKAMTFIRIRKNQELSQLTCIFELLRHRPSALHRIPTGNTFSDAGSAFSSSSYTLGSRGSDSQVGGAVARVEEFLSESLSNRNRPGSVRDVASSSPMSLTSLLPTYKDGSAKSLLSPIGGDSSAVALSNLLARNEGNSSRSLASNEDSGVFGGYTKNTYDDDSASSLISPSVHSNSVDISNHSSPGHQRKLNYRRGKRPPRMPARVPDLDDL